MKKLLFFAFLLSSVAVWSQDRCTGNFVSQVDKKTELERWLTAKAEAPNTHIYQKYKTLLEAHPHALPDHLKNIAYDVLLDQEMLTTAKNLEKVIDEINSSIATHPHFSAEERLRSALHKNLEGKVPANTIATRINEFLAGGSVYRALGENSLVETGIMFHGGNPLAPTADSILGKFIAKHTPATVVRKFAHGGTYAGVGPDKLVVAVDNSMMADFISMMKDEHLFAHYHTPEQGTLMVLHQDNIVTYSGHRFTLTEKVNQLNESAYGTLIPTILLSGTESQRMTQFMTALRDNELMYYAQQPWTLQGYCAHGGYNSCTHWIGNIPIGDEKVTAYTVPGKVDDYANHSLNADPQLDKLPRTQNLAPYDFPANNQLSEAKKELVKRIWKVPGNQQLSYLMGLGKAQERGELANPGWVANVFLSRLKADRSPVVFIFTDNAKTPLAADFVPKIRAY